MGGAAMAKRTIYLAAGCFWGTQKFFDQFECVLHTEVGYANGPDTAPSYEDVCRSVGHAETVRVDYDEARMPLEKLLDYYFLVIDPLSVNRQGHDSGIQYRTGIYWTDPDSGAESLEYCRMVSEELGVQIAVETESLRNFFPAEEYHQKYLDKNPHGYCHIPASYMDLPCNLV
jgi:methionine-S-sulfoxide reductase